MRSHSCGELRPSHVGQRVTLCGWVRHRARPRRHHLHRPARPLRHHPGGVRPADNHGRRRARPSPCRGEFVIRIKGKVRERPDEHGQPKLSTGGHRVCAPRHHECSTAAKTPPFPLDDEKAAKVSEDLRLTYRYLDLRRPACSTTWCSATRSLQAVRQNYLDGHRLHRGRDPHPDQEHPRRRARLPRAQPRQPRHVLRPAAGPAAVQAAAAWWPASTATSRSPAASATRTCAPTASPSSPRSTSKCRSSPEDIYAVIDGMLAEMVRPAGHGPKSRLPIPAWITWHHAMECLRHRQARPAVRHGTDRPHRCVQPSHLQGVRQRAAKRRRGQRRSTPRASPDVRPV
jgi:hypothetical protein